MTGINHFCVQPVLMAKVIRSGIKAASKTPSRSETWLETISTFEPARLKLAMPPTLERNRKPSRLCTSERVSASGSSAQIYTETAAQANAVARKSCGRVKPRERKMTAKTADSTMPSALKMLLPAMTVAT